MDCVCSNADMINYWVNVIVLLLQFIDTFNPITIDLCINFCVNFPGIELDYMHITRPYNFSHEC